ncbi:cell division protein FtsQ/DivIB [Nocardioides cavernaquae]|uniref:Cell division protein FtsQ n=1 Tax=Nocardioides cavernaquae TaxID=2321396 RepID=A0A3A5HIE5_9ACTN|nr:FtsQ-type POTRA domain-containing protein [Nocardioides cavernaquae]RJS47660.1 FtsQ-type POTRA domain-containing protein [Nocardioides cavernaquae]
MRDLLGRPRSSADVVEATRRRFARRQWARRWGTWRIALVLLVLVGLLVALVWMVFASSVLAVRGVEVHGTSMLSRQQVTRAAGVVEGVPLARADLDAIRARVENLAAVESVDVSRSWPHHVRIDVTERQAVAVIDEGDRLRGMDADGVVFRTYATRPKDLPLIRTAPDTRTDAMSEAAEVIGVLPEKVSRRVAYVDVKTRDEIILTLRDGKKVLWGSADQAHDKARVLDALLATSKDATSYDVSVPGQPTTR